MRHLPPTPDKGDFVIPVIWEVLLRKGIELTIH